MKKTAMGMIALFILMACSGGTDLSEAGSAGARRAAEYFYSLLAEGNGQAYVDNMQEAAEMDSSKYGQFVDLMEQYLYEEKQLRGGILGAKATRETMQDDSIAWVFMDVQFGDSTSEEIFVPLVYTRGRWWLR